MIDERTNERMTTMNERRTETELQNRRRNFGNLQNGLKKLFAGFQKPPKRRSSFVVVRRLFVVAAVEC